MGNESVDFVVTSKKIVLAIGRKAMGLDGDELVRFAYNEAIDDACNFVDDMAKSNPQHRMAYAALVKEIRHWLTLRE